MAGIGAAGGCCLLCSVLDLAAWVGGQHLYFELECNCWSGGWPDGSQDREISPGYSPHGSVFGWPLVIYMVSECFRFACSLDGVDSEDRDNYHQSHEFQS